MEEKLYSMKLHDKITTPHFIIIRVPGGWIYIYRQNFVINTFVPFDNKFMPKEKAESFIPE